MYAQADRQQIWRRCFLSTTMKLVLSTLVSLRLLSEDALAKQREHRQEASSREFLKLEFSVCAMAGEILMQN